MRTATRRTVMLKPIHRVVCSPALAACQQLMRRFALWLCDHQVSGVAVTQANLQANMGSAIEGDWLWLLLAGASGTKALLDKAKRIADLPPANKTELERWIQAVRSEEHTSELQSRENLVCRLLLEKK